MALVCETCVNRNFRKWKVSVSEQLLCVLDPSLHDIVVRRCPERLAKSAGKMMNRQLRDFGEHFYSDVFVEMRLYVFADAIGARRCKAAPIRGRFC